MPILIENVPLFLCIGFADKDLKKPSTSIETVAPTDAETSQIKTVTPK